MNHRFWWWGSRSFWKDRECATALLEQVSLTVALAVAKSLQSCPTLCDFVYCKPPGSPVHGISQPRVLAAAAAKSLQSCTTLCDPIDGSPPGSPVPGILQARTLEWVAISFFNA